MLMVIALGFLPANCGVRWREHGIPAAVSAKQNALCAGTESISSGARYASIPESDIDAADSPAASSRTPVSLCIWEGTRFHPADFRSSLKIRSNAKASGSGNTANAKFCPAKGFKAAINFSCCSGDRDRGSLSFARARAASEAAFSALAVRSFCFASSVSTRCCAAVASDASFSRPATRASALAARSCCFPNSILALVKSLSNLRNCSACRLLMMLLVTRTPKPDANVRNNRITAAQSNIVFSPSTVMREIPTDSSLALTLSYSNFILVFRLSTIPPSVPASVSRQELGLQSRELTRSASAWAHSQWAVHRRGILSC